MGADGVIFADKVMCLRNNHDREGADPDGWQKHKDGVANGEIGMIVRAAGKKGKLPIGHKVEFSTQPHRQYTFWDNELNDGGEGSQEWIELAYAVTIHKAQGSQFKVDVRRDPGPVPAALARAAVHGADPPAGQGRAAQAGLDRATSATRRAGALGRPPGD